MNHFVLDASVTLAWFIEDQATEFTHKTLRRIGEDTAVVPETLWRLEVYNGFLKLFRMKIWDEGKLERALDAFARLAVEPVATAPLLESALELARRHQLTSYDACYLLLAKQQGLALATLDGGLKQACTEAKVELLS